MKTSLYLLVRKDTGVVIDSFSHRNYANGIMRAMMDRGKHCAPLEIRAMRKNA